MAGMGFDGGGLPAGLRLQQDRLAALDGWQAPRPVRLPGR